MIYRVINRVVSQGMEKEIETTYLVVPKEICIPSLGFLTVLQAAFCSLEMKCTRKLASETPSRPELRYTHL